MLTADDGGQERRGAHRREEPGKLLSQPAAVTDDATAQVAALVAQDRAFVRALSGALRSGGEIAAGVVQHRGTALPAETDF